MIERKPLEEIKTESARQTIQVQHERFGRTIGVNCCFGSSNIDQMGFYRAPPGGTDPECIYALSIGTVAGGRGPCAGAAPR